MIVTLLGLLSGVGGYVAAGVAVLGTLLAGWVTAEQSGINKAAASTARQTAKGAFDAAQADTSIDRMDGAARRSELLRKFSRD